MKSRGRSKGGYTGTYFSKKNNMSFTFRSSLEYIYFRKLESDPSVVGYISEPFFTYYEDVDGIIKRYFPDLFILKMDGSILVIEIKPKSMVDDPTVQLKASSAREYLLKEFPGQNVKYKFLTEKDIYSSEQERSRYILEMKRSGACR
jgi:hypothetical protein